MKVMNCGGIFDSTLNTVCKITLDVSLPYQSCFKVIFVCRLVVVF